MSTVFFQGQWFDALTGAGRCRYDDCACGAGVHSALPEHLMKPLNDEEKRLYLFLSDLLNVRGAAMRMSISVAPSNSVILDRALECGLVKHAAGRGRFHFGTPKDQVVYLTPAGKRWRNEASVRVQVALERKYARITAEYAAKAAAAEVAS